MKNAIRTTLGLWAFALLLATGSYLAIEMTSWLVIIMGGVVAVFASIAATVAIEATADTVRLALWDGKGQPPASFE